MLRTISNCRNNEKGGLLVATALLLPVLLGFASLALDVAAWRSAKQRMQIGTDAAAIAGAYILREDSYTVADIEAVVAESMAMSGLVGDTSTQTQVAVTEGGQAVQVTMSQPLELFLSSTFLSEVPRVSVVSEARLVTQTQPICLLVLNPVMKTALDLKSGSTIDADGCEVRVNSSDAHALKASGGSAILSAKTCVTGGVNDAGGTFTPNPETGCAPVDDPLADLAEPTVGPCDHTNRVVDGGTVSLSPGVYCGGIAIEDGAMVTLDPGTYILKDGGFTVTGGSVVSGSGVTLFLIGTSAELDIDSGSSIAIGAPTTGPLAQVVIFESRTVDPAKHSIIQGSNIVIDGKIYLPRSELFLWKGSSGEVANPFEMVIANNVALKKDSEVTFQAGSASDAGSDGFKVALSK